MVLYNKEVRKPAIGGCYATNLSLATPANIRKFQNFLDAAPPPYGNVFQYDIADEFIKLATIALLT